MVKLFIIGLLLYIVFNLFRALFIMLKNDPNGPDITTFLGKRVMYSVVVFILILVAMSLGWIKPNPNPLLQPKVNPAPVVKPEA